MRERSACWRSEVCPETRHESGDSATSRDAPKGMSRDIQAQLDVNGWDLRRLLRLVRAPNPIVFEWLSPPSSTGRPRGSAASRRGARAVSRPVASCAIVGTWRATTIRGTLKVRRSAEADAAIDSMPRDPAVPWDALDALLAETFTERALS